jgi:signal transduction histidine kinase
MGLTIGKTLVEGHGGAIAVASARRDTGSTFSVTLPIV